MIPAGHVHIVDADAGGAVCVECGALIYGMVHHACDPRAILPLRPGDDTGAPALGGPLEPAPSEQRVPIVGGGGP